MAGITGGLMVGEEAESEDTGGTITRCVKMRQEKKSDGRERNGLAIHRVFHSPEFSAGRQSDFLCWRIDDFTPPVD